MTTFLTETYQMASPGSMAIGFAIGTGGIVVIFGAPFVLPFVQSFRRQPDEAPLRDRVAASEWGMGAFGVIMLVIGIVLSGFLVLDFTVNVRLKEDALHIDGGSYDARYQGKSTDNIPLSALHLSDARVLRNRAKSDYVTSERTSGLGLPGLLTGWFRLQNGQEAFVYLVDAPETVLIPTTEEYVFLFDVRRPYDLLDALRRRQSVESSR